MRVLRIALLSIGLSAGAAVAQNPSLVPIRQHQTPHRNSPCREANNRKDKVTADQ